MSNKRYIYNVQQAKFFIRNNGIVIDTGIHHKTGKTYWVFEYSKTVDLMAKWCEA